MPSTSMPTADQMSAAARHYLNTPFEHAGRSQWGLDCVGLLLCVAWDLGLTNYNNVNYSRIVNPDHMKREIDKFCDALSPDQQMQVGDIVLFSIDGSAQHAGMITQIEDGCTWFIHSHETVGKVVEHRLIMTWAETLACVYRWKGMS